LRVTQSITLRLRGLWFSVHKWIGLTLAVLIIPISVTGSALVWHDALDEAVNPQRYLVSTSVPARDPGAYASAAQSALAPGERLASIRYPEHDGGPIVATAVAAPGAGGGPPARTNVWLDPGTARVLDKASSNAGLVRVLHQLHGSLMVPGWGRTIVGWVGVFMFCSCLTGIWLWWPLTGSVKRGLRWRRQNSTNANIHHLAGFWVLLPLAMLSFTGFWISFPSVFSTFEASQPKAKGGGAPPDRARAARAQPLARTRMFADSALAAARPLATGPLVSIAWPTDQSPAWKFSFERQGGPAEVAVDDATGEVTPPRPPRPETNARTMRRWHDGTGMGALWQILIFVGGIIPAILSVTGIVMWSRSRGWRATLAKRRKAVRLARAPAE
jgi:uncharacterized iron-regulated membrane protein